MKIVWAGSALATLFLVLLLSTEIIKRGRLEKAFSELTPTERRTSATACFQDAPDVSYLMRMGSSHRTRRKVLAHELPITRLNSALSQAIRYCRTQNHTR